MRWATGTGTTRSGWTASPHGSRSNRSMTRGHHNRATKQRASANWPASSRTSGVDRGYHPGMPRYMVVRAFDCGEAQMPSVGRKSRELIENKYSTVTWEHSHVTLDESGKVRTFCIYDAPD